MDKERRARYPTTLMATSFCACALKPGETASKQNARFNAVHAHRPLTLLRTHTTVAPSTSLPHPHSAREMERVSQSPVDLSATAASPRFKLKPDSTKIVIVMYFCPQEQQSSSMSA